MGKSFIEQFNIFSLSVCDVTHMPSVSDPLRNVKLLPRPGLHPPTKYHERLQSRQADKQAERRHWKHDLLGGGINFAGLENKIDAREAVGPTSIKTIQSTQQSWRELHVEQIFLCKFVNAINAFLTTNHSFIVRIKCLSNEGVTDLITLMKGCQSSINLTGGSDS